MAGKRYKLDLVPTDNGLPACGKCWYRNRKCPKGGQGMLVCASTARPKNYYWKLMEVHDG